MRKALILSLLSSLAFAYDGDGGRAFDYARNNSSTYNNNNQSNYNNSNYNRNNDEQNQYYNNYNDYTSVAPATPVAQNSPTCTFDNCP